MEVDLRIKRWNPRQCKTNDVFKGLPLNVPVKKTVIQNGSQTIALVSIKKENLSYDAFQRPIDKKRSDKIASAFHPDFGVVNVAEMEHEGKWYYTIVDGQHRSEANPENSVAAIVSNHLPPAWLFMTANTNGKNIDKDDILWALYEGYDPTARWLFQTLRIYGMEPSRNTGDEGKKNRESQKFVAAAKLYDVYTKIRTSYVNSAYKKLEEDEKVEKTKELFVTLCNIMTKSYGAHTFYASEEKLFRKQSVSGYRDVWMAMVQYLNAKSWNVESQDIISALQTGCYGMREPMSETFETINDLTRLCKRKYLDHYAGNESRRQEGYSKVIKNMVASYKKHVKK